MRTVLSIVLAVSCFCFSAYRDRYNYGPAEGRLPAKLVAASNSSSVDRAAADYVCDGTDDHVELNLALAASDKTVLAPGTYSIDNGVTGLTVDSGDYLEGYGATIQFEAGTKTSMYGIYATAVTDVTIVGITVDGNKANITESGTYEASAIYFKTNCFRIKIIDCRVINMGHAADASNDSGRGIFFDDVEDSLVKNCTFYDNERQDITFYNNTQYCTMENCFADGNDDRAYVLHLADFNRIVNCTAVDTGGHGINFIGASSNVVVGTSVINPTGSGVALQVDTATGSTKNTFEGCYIYSSETYGFYIVASTEDYNVITNCTIDSCDIGISLGSEYNLVTGNYIYDSGGEAGGIGNSITVTGDYNRVLNNFIHGLTKPYYAIRVLAGGEYNVFSGNSYSGSYQSGTYNDLDSNNAWGFNTGTSPNAAPSIVTAHKTIDVDDDASTDDYQFDDDAANTTEQVLTITNIVPAYAEVISVQLRCIETVVGPTVMSIDIGTTSGGAEVLAAADTDTANEINTTAAGAGPLLAATNAARSLYVNATPAANWSTLTGTTPGRWVLYVTYIDYASLQ